MKKAIEESLKKALCEPYNPIVGNKHKNRYIDQALTLLKQPKCKTCGDTKEVLKPMPKIPHPCNYVNLKNAERVIPCPDCQQPPEGEFTKEWRRKLENAVTLYKMGKSAEEWFQSMVTGFREACDRLDRAEAREKEQTTEFTEKMRIKYKYALAKKLCVSEEDFELTLKLIDKLSKK